MLNNITDTEVIKSFMSDSVEFIKTLPAADIRYNHKFVNGVYIRKMYLKAGTILASKVHKTEHIFIVNKGRILVYDGIHEAVILKAPYDGVTLSGTRRMGIALEDVIWINIHPTNIKPLDDSVEALEEALLKIEKKVIEPYKHLHLNI